MAEQRFIPFGEFNKFREWWDVFTGRGRFADWRGSGYDIHRNFLISDPAYQEWLKQGQPSKEEWLADWEPVRRADDSISEWRITPVSSVTKEDIKEKEEELFEKIDKITTLEKLKALIETEVDEGNIVDEFRANEIYAEKAWEVDPYRYAVAEYGLWEDEVNDLKSFASKTDLFDKISKLGVEKDWLDDDIAEKFYKGIVSRETSWSLARREREASDQKARETERLGRYKTFLDKRAWERQTRAGERQKSEGQTADALLASLNKRPTQEREGLPPITGEGDILKSFLTSTGLGKGTKLRRFIASEAEDMASGVRASRLAWWKKMHEPEEEEATFESEQTRLQGEADRWKRIASAAPSSKIAGVGKEGTYYGPGGLKGIAEEAAARAFDKLYALKPGDFPTPSPGRVGVTAEDPFKKALRRKDFRASYFRQPGAGLARSLTPAARF